MEDYRTLLAIVRGRSLEAASELLEVNHSTVYRRLVRLERRTGKLFDRNGSVYTPTKRAQAILPVALRLEREAIAFERIVSTRTQQFAGKLRLTLPSTLLPLVRHAIVDFQAANPNAQITILDTSEIVDVLRGGADVALRMTSSPDPDLVGRRIASVAWCAYARIPADPTTLRWAAYTEGFRRLEAIRYRRKTWPGVVEMVRVESVSSMVQILGADDLAGYCPCYIADTEPALRRLTDPIAHGSAWVLYAPELRKSHQLQALVESLVSTLQRRRHLLEGRQVP